MTMVSISIQPPDPGRALPSPDESTWSHADRNVQARNNDQVYQAVGDQYIHYHRSAPVSTPPVNALPRDTSAFVGRDRELQVLIDAVRGRTGHGTAIPVYAIDGMPGVGKTTLAVRLGHLMRDWFPDGQIFLDLHGHTPGRQPLSPDEALFDLLSTAGTKPALIPRGVDARAGLWRAHLAGKRALVILDNAAGRWQVQPLLPSAHDSLVLVTSRRRLVGLTARQAAQPLPLGTLPEDDAVALFAAMTARHPDPAEAPAVRELVRLAGHLPLAICVLAARFRLEPQWMVSAFVRELSETTHRLAHMRAEDLAVAATFDLSYRQLATAQRRFLRRLGLFPGRELERYAAAALDDSSPARAQRHLEALYRDHFLDQPTYGRYRMHDLVKEFAATRAEQDPAQDRELARRRLLDYYEAAAHAAARHLGRPGRNGRTGTMDRGDHPRPALPPVATRPQALAWFRTEQDGLLSCVDACATVGQQHRLPAYSAVLADYFRLAGPWERAVSLHRAAVRVARHENAAPALASALYELGVVHRLRGEYDAAHRTLSEALESHEGIDHQLGAADTLTQLAAVQRRTGDHDGAAQSLDRALARYERLGDRAGQADALDELGVVRYHLDDHRSALATLRKAQSLHRAIGDALGEANALNQFGVIQLLSGELPPAIEAHRRALAILHDLGDRHGEARALNYLGVAQCHAGEYDAAKTSLDEALRLHRDLGYRPGESNALNYLGVAHRETGDLVAAERSLVQALAIYVELGYQPGEADALNQLGILSRRSGDHGAAAHRHDESLTLFRRLSDDLGQAEALNSMGDLLVARGDPTTALTRYRRALRLARRAHNPQAEAHALAGIGEAVLRAGTDAKGEAATQLRQAAAICRRIGAPHTAQRLADLLAELADPAPP